MAKDLIIQDVAEAVILDGDGNAVAHTKLQMSSIEGTINEEDLRAGIGNKKIFKIRSEKDINLSFRNAVFTEDFLAMTQGVEVEKNKTVQVTRAETICLVEGEDEITLLGTPVNSKVKIKIADGTFKEVDAVGKTVDLTGETDLLAMEELEVIYKEDVTGNSIEFDAEKFSKTYRVELRTIAYDLDTSEVYSDIYFIFPNCMPGGDWSLSFEAGSVITPEISFSVLQPKCGSAMGEMINVPRTTP